MTDLIFRGLQDGSPDLFFGREGPPDGADAHIAIAAQLPAITASASAAVAYGAQINAVLLAPTGAVSVQYRSEVSRPTVGAAADSIQQAVPRTGRAADSATLAQGLALPHRACWQQAAGRTSRVQGMWQGARRRLSVTDARFAQAVPHAAALQSDYQDARAARRPLGGVFQDALGVRSPLSGSFQEAFRTRRRAGTFRFQGSRPETAELAIFAHVGMSAKSGIRTQFQEAMPPRRGIRVPVVVPPVGGYVPPQGDAVHLLFKVLRTSSFDLLFSDGLARPVGPVVIPVLRYYIVINSASLTRVSNNLALPVTGLSLSIDSDSSHWTWSASLPLRSLADLEPDAPGELVELEAIVNGLPWRLAVERVRETERFGSASLSIGGRGIAAELSDPTYPVVSHDNVASAMTAQQLAADALSINGVPLGWDLDWQAADWLVPAGAWVHSGTPLDAVVRIAAAAGAYVQAAPGSRALRVVPRYPVAPWEWSSATPALVLPASAVIERGTEHVNRAAYNVVYVSGQAGGVLARVKRAGSAGDRAAQMIVDGLVTHADAARGRGLEVLGNTGAQQIVSLETGILPASGVIHVGTLMDWTRGAVARRGLVRSLSVTASVPTGASKDPVKVRQTIGVETHG